MSYRIRVPLKTVPLDEAHLISGAERVLWRLQEHPRAILVGAGVVLVAIAIVVGILWFDYQTNEKARALDREATLHYLTRPTDQPQKADANLKQAIALYRQIVDQYPRTSAAPVALYHLGNALVQGNEIDAAIEAYKRYTLLYHSNASLLGLVQQRLGYAYLLKGDWNQAAKAFLTVAALPGTVNKDHALFELGKLEESQSRPVGALSHYQELTKDFPRSPFASEAAVRVKVLEGKKITDGPAAAAEPTSQSPPTSKTPSK